MVEPCAVVPPVLPPHDGASGPAPRGVDTRTAAAISLKDGRAPGWCALNVGHGRSKKLTNRHYVPGFRAGFHNVTFVLKGPPSSRFKLYTLLTC